MIAEYVVIRDHDHSIDSIPYSKAGFSKSKIYIGKNVWIGYKATILKGSEIGDNAVIGAHSLVKNKVYKSTVVVGIPAKVIKNLRF